MSLEELLISEITESQLLRSKLVKETEEKEEVAVYNVPENAEEFKKSVIDYMNGKGIELTQENYNCVVDLWKKGGSDFHDIVTKKKTVNTLTEYSVDEMKEITQLCILKQCEKIFQLLKSQEEEQRYEYEVTTIEDRKGATDIDNLTKIINSYAKRGWRVKSVFTNELGHNASAISVAGIASGVNYTADEVVVIFERKIKE